LNKAHLRVLFALTGLKLVRRPNLPFWIEVTTRKDDLWILAASVTYEEHCVPLYMEVWQSMSLLYDFLEKIESFMQDLGELLLKG
jgi:hypothetical protein